MRITGAGQSDTARIEKPGEIGADMVVEADDEAGGCRHSCDVNIALSGVKPIREKMGSRLPCNRLLRRSGMTGQVLLFRPFSQKRQRQGSRLRFRFVVTTIMKPYQRRRKRGPVERFLLGALLVFVATLYGRSIVGPSLLMAYPVVMAATAALVLFWPRAHNIILGGGQHQASSDARAEQWRIGIPKLLSHPFGHGVGRGNDALGFFNRGGKGTVDTCYLTVMLDSGVIALPLFLLIFLIPAWLAFKGLS